MKYISFNYLFSIQKFFLNKDLCFNFSFLINFSYFINIHVRESIHQFFLSFNFFK